MLDSVMGIFNALVVECLSGELVDVIKLELVEMIQFSFIKRSEFLDDFEKLILIAYPFLVTIIIHLDNWRGWEARVTHKEGVRT